MLFTKMHGLGNNYVVFNELTNDWLLTVDYEELSRVVSDVHFGIGSDGIIVICPSEVADFKMRIFNKDGSEAKNCGNGLRCVAKFVYDYQTIIEKQFTIETLGGVVQVEVEVDERNIVSYVTVDMGEPMLLKEFIPMKGNPLSISVNETYHFKNEQYNLTCLSMGNPHAVMFVEEESHIIIEEIGPIIEYADLFPERVNVSVVHVKNRQELNYRVWERGSGITMACGTGACAAVVAATLNELVDSFQPICVHLPGGDLTVKWDEHGHVWMRGDASYVCHGQLDDSLLQGLKK